MSSYGLHLANLAAANGIDLAKGSVDRILCTAEPVSASKRAKLEREWGAEVYDCFGMTECSMMGAESEARDGFHIWTDLAHVEVLDEHTMKPVGEGRPGVFVMTPLFNSNNGAGFLRWNSGDIVTWQRSGKTKSGFSVFPVIRHAHRTGRLLQDPGRQHQPQEFRTSSSTFRKSTTSRRSWLPPPTAPTGSRCRSRCGRAATRHRSRRRFRSVRRRCSGHARHRRSLETRNAGEEFRSSVKAPRFADRRT